MSLAPGMTIGRYQIIEQLGQGGMATVYRAVQPSLNRQVALKVLRAGLADDEEFRERFVREAQSVARLQHPNIIQVFDFETVDGHYLMAMELLERGTLRDRLLAHARAGTRFERSEIARIVWEVADALSAAHELGIVHRDIKPSNVLLAQRDRAVVADFGIAKIVGGTKYTQTGMGIGTPEYMSPEQAENRDVDARADLYSLGVMAYEMVTGRVPFTGDTPLAVALAHIRTPIPSPRSIDPTISEATEEVLLRALEKDPDARYPTTLAFASELRDALAGGGPALERTVVVGRTTRERDGFASTAPTPAAVAAPAVAAPAVAPLAAAGFWLRFLGRCIDLGVAAAANALIAGAVRAGGLEAEFGTIVGTVNSWLAFVGPQTLGKQVLGLRVVAADGSRLRWTRGLLRLLAAVLAVLPLGLGYLAVAFDKDKRGWHDRMAGTSVVRGGVPAGGRLASAGFLVLIIAAGSYAAFGPADFPLSVQSIVAALPTPTPSARPVTLRPDEAIIPPEEFPFTGYRVTADGATASEGAPQWRRVFAGPTGSEFPSVTVYLAITAPDRMYPLAGECSWNATSGVLPKLTSAYGAERIGERSRQCLFTFADGARTFREEAAARNYVVTVYLSPSSSASDDRASIATATIARRQLEIVDRVAPP